MVQVKSFYAHNDLRNFSYVVFDKSSGSAWVIDPFEAGPIATFIKEEGLNLRRILNTHQHWDHIRGNSALQSLFKCEIASALVGSSVAMSDGHTLSVLGTPGHTADHRAFIWNSAKKSEALFSGDTLFNAGVGNCKNGGNVSDLYQTTMELVTLPEETVLWPGHDYMKRNLAFAQKWEPENKDIREALRMIENSSTEDNLGWTLGMEKKVNPFLRLESEEIAENVLGKSQISEELKKDLFVKLRKLRDDW